MGMILVRHGERSRHEGFAELQAVLQMDRDGTYFKASAPALRTAGINGPHIVLCGDWRPLDLDPSSRRGEEYLSRMFRAGCESTRDYLIAQLRSERHPRKAAELGPQTGHNTWAGIEVVETDADRTAMMLTNWGPVRTTCWRHARSGGNGELKWQAGSTIRSRRHTAARHGRNSWTGSCRSDAKH